MRRFGPKIDLLPVAVKRGTDAIYGRNRATVPYRLGDAETEGKRRDTDTETRRLG